jgi:hypothetical protein
MGSDKKKECEKKKCQKKCKTTYYYCDYTTIVYSEPVFDVYAMSMGADTSFTLFGHTLIYSDIALTIKVGTAEITGKTLYNLTVNPPRYPQVVVNITAFLDDGVTSASFQLFTATTSMPSLTEPIPDPGTYKTICYSSTGLYYDQTLYISATVPQTGNIGTIEVKACTRKSCA